MELFVDAPWIPAGWWSEAVGRIDDAANQGLTVLAEMALGGSRDCSRDNFAGTLSTTWF